MAGKATTEREGTVVKRIRDIAGIVGVVGVAVLGGFALTNLKPGWEWTQEDRHEENAGTTVEQ